MDVIATNATVADYKELTEMKGHVVGCGMGVAKIIDLEFSTAY